MAFCFYCFCFLPARIYGGGRGGKKGEHEWGISTGGEGGEGGEEGVMCN